MAKELLSYDNVYKFCSEIRTYYLRLCERDHNSAYCREVLYGDRISGVARKVLNSFAEAASVLNAEYRECLFSFAPVDWDFSNVDVFLKNGLSFPEWLGVNDHYKNRHKNYILSTLGESKVAKYTKAYSEYLKEQKKVQQKMIRFALEKADEPVIVYEEVLEYAKRKLDRNKDNMKLKEIVEYVERQNNRLKTTGMSSGCTVGNYYFK